MVQSTPLKVPSSVVDLAHLLLRLLFFFPKNAILGFSVNQTTFWNRIRTSMKCARKPFAGNSPTSHRGWILKKQKKNQKKNMKPIGNQATPKFGLPVCKARQNQPGRAFTGFCPVGVHGIKVNAVKPRPPLFFTARHSCFISLPQKMPQYNNGSSRQLTIR